MVLGVEADVVLGVEADVVLGVEADLVLGVEADLVLGVEADLVLGVEADLVLGVKADLVLGVEADLVLGVEADLVLGVEADGGLLDGPPLDMPLDVLDVLDVLDALDVLDVLDVLGALDALDALDVLDVLDGWPALPRLPASLPHGTAVAHRVPLPPAPRELHAGQLREPAAGLLHDLRYPRGADPQLRPDFSGRASLKLQPDDFALARRQLLHGREDPLQALITFVRRRVPVSRSEAKLGTLLASPTVGNKLARRRLLPALLARLPIAGDCRSAVSVGRVPCSPGRPWLRWEDQIRPRTVR